MDTTVIPISITNQACLFALSRLLSAFLDDFASFFAFTEGEQIIIPRMLTSEVLAAIQSVRFIAQHIKDSDRDNEVSRLRNDFRERKKKCQFMHELMIISSS